MNRFFLTLIAILISSPVLALSCMRANLGDQVTSAIQSSDTYALTVGSVTATEPVLSPFDLLKQGKKLQPTRFKAEVTGGFVGKKGLVPMKTPLEITVELNCIADWCGAFPKKPDPMIMFLKKSDAGWVFPISACPGSYFLKPTDAEIRAVSRCIRRNGCVGKDAQLLNRY